MSDRIYPFAIKKSSGIKSWSNWPDDVKPILEDWNRRGHLSFGNYNVFKCVGCDEFCQQNLGAILKKSLALGEKDLICDDCLIDLVRKLTG